MKLATLRNGRPDGQLAVVSSDLNLYVSAGRIAPTLQAALDDWDRALPRLREVSDALNAGGIAAQPFEPSLAMAPLPRAYQFIDGSAYLVHLERVRRLKGSRQEEPQGQRPLFYQGASDSLCAASDPMVAPEGDFALDFEAEVAVILGPVGMRPGKGEAAAAIRLVTVCNDVTLRRLVADDLDHGFGFFHSKPATSFAPVVATPDELGEHWSGNRLNLHVQASVNDILYGQPNAATDMHFDFADLAVAAAQTRRLGAGTILGGGTIANRHDETLPIKVDGIGFACIAEARSVERQKYGRPRTPFLKAGDRVRIAAVDKEERPVFGMIDQTVTISER
jgi:fumarylacetoacetate (FAA) hydrolase